MPNEARDVYAGRKPINHVKEFTKVLPINVDFADIRPFLDNVDETSVRHRRKRCTAVADNDRCDALREQTLAWWIVQEREVGVRVVRDIYEAGRNHQPLRIDGLIRGH